MPKGQHKKTINKSQGNIALPEPSSPTTASPEYLNITETHTHTPPLKSNCMKMTKVLKEEVNKSFKEKQEKTNKIGGNKENP